MSSYSPSVASWAQSVARETGAIPQETEPLGPHPTGSQRAPSVLSHRSQRYDSPGRASAGQSVVDTERRPFQSRAPSAPPSYTESERYRLQMVPSGDHRRSGAAPSDRERTSTIRDRSNLSQTYPRGNMSDRGTTTIHPDDSATRYSGRSEKHRQSQMGMVMATVPEYGAPSASTEREAIRRRGGSSYLSGDGTSFSISRSSSATYSKVTSIDSAGITHVEERLSFKNRGSSRNRRVKEKSDHDGPRVDRLQTFLKGRPVFE